MTGAWAAIGAAVLAIGAQGGKPVPTALPEEPIRITAPRQSENLETGVTRFMDGVTVRYGPTTITAEEVVSDRAKQHATALGNVLVSDPEGTIQANDLELDWSEGNRRATARDVRIEIAGARLRAQRATLTDTLWVFENLEGTTCRRDSPLYLVKSPRLEIVPGKSGRLIKPKLSLFGKELLTVPTQRFNLDPRVQGIRLPNVAYRRDQGLGVAWNGQFLLDDQSAAAFDLGAFKGGYPNYGVGISRSFISSEKTKAFLAPRDDLGDRFNLGYFDSIETNSPDVGFRTLSNPRSTLSLSSQFNRGAVVGPPDLSYSKPIDIAYEAGRRLGPLGIFGQVRAQEVRAQNYPTVNRLAIGGTALTDVIPIGPKLGALATFDFQSYLGGSGHAWARGSAGVVYQALPQLRLGAAGYLGKEVGTADFPADDLYVKNGYAMRADLAFGGFRARYMVKFDSRRKWYDREYSVNQVVGCLEGYVLYRQFPQTYVIGVKVRVDQFVDLLQRKKFERTQPLPPPQKTVISAAP